jgi:tripartite-type tricarboxylate transporter receptor subunit TctC
MSLSDTGFLAAALLAASAAPLLHAAEAPAIHSYPNKPVRIVTTGIGGGLDLTARLLAPPLAERLGQPVIVENRTNSVVPIEIVSKAPADGYTLLVFGPPLWLGPLLQTASYDPVKDFVPVTLAVGTTSVLAVYPRLPVSSVKDLIALAKAKPGALNYASNATGAGSHLAAELFKNMAGVDLVRVTYNSNAVLIPDLISGQVHVMFGSGGTLAPHLKSGKLRPLAVTSAQPSLLFPGLPTVSSAGLPGYESTSMFGVFAPARTPTAVVRRLNQDLVYALARNDVKERFLNGGLEPIGSSPEESRAKIGSEIARMDKVIKAAGIRME